MDTPQNFRTAFIGFNRAEVVRYLEYVNAKQAAQVGQLTEEADALRQKLAQTEEAAAGSDSVSFEELEDLRTKLEASESSNAALENRCADLEERMAEKIALEQQVEELQQKLNEAPAAETAVPDERLAEKDARIAELEQKLAEKDARLSELEKLPQEKQALEAQIADLEEKLTNPVQTDSQLALQAQLQRRCVELEKNLTAVTAEKEGLEQQTAALSADVAALEQKLAQRPAAAVAAPQQDHSLAEQELAAYRRAERAERVARERADLVYQKTNGILADATAKVDSVAGDIGSMADDIMSQLQTLQAAVTGSKQALKEAAEIMYSLRPQADED